MKALINFTGLTLLLFTLTLTSCSDDDNESPTPENDSTIVETAQATADLSSLVSALQKADESADNDLISALSGDGPFTVFAPTNAAFSDLLAQLDGFDSLDDFNSQELQNLLATILTYHVIVGTAAQSSDLSNGQTLTTLQGATLEVSTEGGVSIGDATDSAANVTTADIQTSNGVVHIINKVLLPQTILDQLADIILVPITDVAIGNENLENLVAALVAADGDLPTVLRGDGPFTVLAPTDEAFENFLDGAALEDIPVDVLTNVLLNHVLSGSFMAADLTNLGSGYESTLATGAGDENLSIFFDTSDGVTFNGVSTVSTPDVKALNGVIHIVNAVIDLPNIVDHAVANPNLSSLVAALTDGGNTTFTDLLSNEEEDFTVFAPVNTAFDAFTNPNSNDINTVLSNHVVVGTSAFSSGLSNSYVNTAAEFEPGANYSLYINTDDGVTLNGISDVVIADIVATNGVIHAVETVIDLPNVVDFVAADPTFDSLEASLTTDGQPDFILTLLTGGPFTIFAPTNDAFQALLDSNSMWNSPSDIDSALLTSVLQHHVISGANIRSGDLTPDGNTVTPATLEGDTFTITLPGTDGNIADVTDGAGNTGIGIDVVDLQAANGVIHVLDAVLLPDTNN
ncbi:fasciclin domain-containing protein [Flagellimonas nanhaiensis]|uniref:Fasciclin domain-containing protein n=1 Tax=Flagellimonas nanhaiensis TaxID=2292706 RepID=A0A371JMD1_9FLAO|nr:fasciclin domain-containing protein [Allomuricauda nanhaiensis]RDY58299.1 fasciclin domain-containing protein [Allomuricauda nanhaiensis]